ncbi:MAG: hypothetical protein MJY87_02370 [Fibrobacter sp.]|nr:hypothetical protein [Fibrobacter sp.]
MSNQDFASNAALFKEAEARFFGDLDEDGKSESLKKELDAHVSDKGNPHEVTAEQVGTYTKEQVTAILEAFDLIDDALGRERELRDLIDSVAHGTNMVAFEDGQDVFMTILDYFARKPVPYAATFYSDSGYTTNTLTNVPPILVTDKQTAGFKLDCFCLFDIDSPGSDDKPDYARSILLEYTNNKSDAGYIKFLGRIGNSSHTRPTKPSNSYWEQFLNGKMCDGTFNYKSNKVATVKTVTDKINALDVNDAAVANQFVTAVKETDGKVSVSRRQPVIGDVSGLQASLDVKVEKDELSSAIAAHNASQESHEDIRSAVRDETSARVLYDSQLRESIEALEEKAEEFVTGEEVSEAIASEADARIQEDIAINARIDMIPQTDWNETDEGSMAYLANHPTPISDIDIEALFS